jgi:hypothetical protein
VQSDFCGTSRLAHARRPIARRDGVVIQLVVARNFATSPEAMKNLRRLIDWVRGLFSRAQEFDDETPGPKAQQCGPWID